MPVGDLLPGGRRRRWSPLLAAAVALARALAWNKEIDLDTLNVASQYRSGVLTWDFRLDHELVAAFGGGLRLER